MPLLSLWKADPAAVKQLTIEQIVSTAGDGRLRDDSECQAELRAFLSQASVDDLARYADYCLVNSFPKSGQVLQDVVNELGRRLEYQVTNGRYQGSATSVGFDGLWNDPSGHSIVVEVKTTDAYRLSLDTVVRYRDSLHSQHTLTESSSVLLIVGRTDTGELEAQVRGSRHAWDIRLINIDSLINLVRVKESADSQETIAKIRKLLTPIEYTRLDELIDVMFTAAQDVESAASSEATELEERGPEPEREKGVWMFTPSALLQAKREAIIEIVSREIDVHLVKKSRATYWDASHTRRVICTISKRYESNGALRYWYAYHPAWDEFLGEGEVGLVALGCMDLDIAFLVPLADLREHLLEFYITEKKDGSGHYWHIQISETDEGNFILKLPASGRELSMKRYERNLKHAV